jgi:hypothetical protein
MFAFAVTAFFLHFGSEKVTALKYLIRIKSGIERLRAVRNGIFGHRFSKGTKTFNEEF